MKIYLIINLWLWTCVRYFRHTSKVQIFIIYCSHKLSSGMLYIQSCYFLCEIISFIILKLQETLWKLFVHGCKECVFYRPHLHSKWVLLFILECSCTVKCVHCHQAVNVLLHCSGSGENVQECEECIYTLKYDVWNKAGEPDSIV